MIKDRVQKQLAVKFCAAQGIVPFAEVIVRAQTGLEENIVDITDVDVLGIDLGRLGSIQRLLFDCKSGGRQSAINRALWAGGLKSLVKANSAHVIQKKEAPDTHKLVANTFNVHIHSEDSFMRYANSITPNFGLDITYLDDMAVWDALVGLDKTQPSFGDGLSFVTTQAALDSSGPKGIRLGLATLMKVSGELDPTRRLDRLMFGAYVSAFLIFLCISISALKNVFQFSMNKENFEHRLRYFIWEGRENYVLRSKLRAAAAKADPVNGASPLDLPEWRLFVELMRSFLDSPEALAPLAFLSKEMAFRSFITKPRAAVDDHLRSLFIGNSRARQFIFATATYLVHAAKLPKQFAERIESDINGLLKETPPVTELKLL